MAGRRELLLEVAAGLIARHGYAKTAVADVAEAAGIAKGSVYREFASKDEMLAELLRTRSQRLLERVRDAVEADPDGARLSAVCRHGLRALLDDPLLCALYTRDTRVLGTRVRAHGPDPARHGWMGEIVLALREAGLIRSDLPIDAVAHVLGVIATGMITVGEASAAEDTLRVLTELVARGLEPVAPVDPESGRRAVRALADRLGARVTGPGDDARTDRPAR
ncbi:TetR/AcrR family transcriptional regulator [Pseudonocardia sp. H11422]|uniref:TetR/AcrR family transcriptional regulator n=1 Tax=Pseudonocardia sp. H11422 TaxID=2835866 RepID=UPI001BDCF819|nr:TetR/AcrR family transcriptional regulator [Pseudonocardia sp. H11422]